MTEFLVIIALIFSVISFLSQKRAQARQRHGEMERLRFEFTAKLVAVRRQNTSTQMHVEPLKLALRRLRDSEEKHQAMKRVADILQKLTALEQSVLRVERKLEDFDTLRTDAGPALTLYQNLDRDSRSLEDRSRHCEQECLREFIHVRERLQGGESRLLEQRACSG